MTLTKKPFRNYSLDEDKKTKKREIVSLSLSKEERKQLNEDKKVLQQTKDGTAIKQLMNIGHIVIHDDKLGKISQVILNNRRRNKRIGITEFD